jgi:AraC-like DNA-binding protein
LQALSTILQHEERSEKQDSSSFLYFFGFFALFLSNRIPANVYPHGHHLLKIFISLDHSFNIEYDGKWREIKAAIIGPDKVHRFVSGEEGNYAVLYLEGESKVAMYLCRECLGSHGLCILPPSLFMPVKDSFKELFNGRSSIEDVSFVSNTILNLILEYYKLEITKYDPKIDPRINKAITFIKESSDKKARINTVTQEVGLSESRLIHLFTSEVGVPPRRYSLWLRLLDAINEIIHGASFTEAAYAAGFSDSAHLSRTFRQMFGLSLIDVFKNPNVNIAGSFKQI